MSAASSTPTPDEIEDKIRSALIQAGVKVVDELPPRRKGFLVFEADVLNEILGIDAESGIKNVIKNAIGNNIKEVILVRCVQWAGVLAFKVRGLSMMGSRYIGTHALDSARTHSYEH